jgi:hypothetical protein
MPKTGTTSIQDSLYFRLGDRRFRYISLGHVNGSIPLITLFSDRPEVMWPFQLIGMNPSRIPALKTSYTAGLRRALWRALRAGETPIVSAECCWNFSESELRRVHDFITAAGFSVRIVAYLRPIKSWMESRFQQAVKVGHWRFDPWFRALPGEAGGHEITAVLSRVARVFGTEYVTVRAFQRSRLVAGCVVRDFCHVAGIAFDARAIIRSNDSLSLDAVRVLCAYHRYRDAPLPWTELLAQRVSALGGAPLRFHSAFLSDWRSIIAAEHASVNARYGLDLSEDFEGYDAGPSVRTPDDLFSFSRPVMEWLAVASRSPVLDPGEGEEVARRVAAQVARIHRHLPLRLRLGRAEYRARVALRWIARGD